MNGKKIAVFITDWDPNAWGLLLKGIRNRAKLDGYDVYAFNCSGGAGDKRKHDIGEFHIFDLPKLKEFDGMIVAASTIIPTRVVDRLAERIVRSGQPGITLEVSCEGVDFGGIDNVASQRMMMEHVIKAHRCERIYFVSGPEGNAESDMRKKAYFDAMREHGLEAPDYNCFTGNYQFDSGIRAVNYFQMLPDGLPQAIVCANDLMAMGVCRRLEELGVRVPDQVIVTGFDNIDDSKDFVPSITTISRPREELGAEACDYIIKRIEDPAFGDGLKCKTSLQIRESCGCEGTNLYVGRRFRKEHFRKMETEANVTRTMNKMMARLTDCDFFSELYICLEDYIDRLKCERFYFCLDSDLINQDNEAKHKWNGENTIYSQMHWRKTGFPENVRVVVARNGKEEISCNDYDGSQILPEEEKQYKSDSDFYIYAPVHYQDNCFGYCVVVNPTSVRYSLGFSQWMLMVGSSIETIRRKNLMNAAIEQLDDMYIRDQLTGLYNRFGFERYSADLIANCIERRQPLVCVFFDLDGLKKINDRHGHEGGDVAIRTVAEVLLEVKDAGDIVTRRGGDEFLVLCSARSDVVENKIGLVEEKLNNRNKTLELPFLVSASVGYRIAFPEEDFNLDELIEEADRAMYENKKRKKKHI